MGARRPRQASVLALRPGERGAVGVRGVGGREDDGERRVGVGLPEGAEPVEGAGVRELQAAEAGHEVAAADAAGLLEGLQHRVDGREPARDLLEGDRVAGEDAVALQQLLGERLHPLGGAGGPSRGREQAPAADGRGRDLPARAEPRHPMAPLRPDGVRRQEGAQRLRRVVRDLARPRQVPQRVHDRAGQPAPRRVDDSLEERRPVTGEVLANPLVDVALRRPRDARAGGAAGRPPGRGRCARRGRRARRGRPRPPRRPRTACRGPRAGSRGPARAARRARGSTRGRPRPGAAPRRRGARRGRGGWRARGRRPASPRGAARGPSSRRARPACAARRASAGGAWRGRPPRTTPGRGPRAGTRPRARGRPSRARRGRRGRMPRPSRSDGRRRSSVNGPWVRA